MLAGVVGKRSAVPNPVTKRAIDERSPKDRIDDHRAELHPLGKRTADQGRRDDEEHALEQHVRQPRHAAFHRRHRFARSFHSR